MVSLTWMKICRMENKVGSVDESKMLWNKNKVGRMWMKVKYDGMRNKVGPTWMEVGWEIKRVGPTHMKKCVPHMH